MKQLTVDGRLQMMNRAGLEMINAESLEQVQGHCVYPMVVEEHRAAFQRMLHDVFLGQRQSLEFKMIGLKGKTRWLFSQAVPLRNDQGDIVSALSVTVDITDRKEAEEKLKCLNSQNELILSSVLEGILGLNLKNEHTFVNLAASRMLGFEVGELIGRPSHQAWHHTRADGSPYKQEDCKIYDTVHNGAIHKVSSEIFWRKDGSSFPVEYVSTPVYEDGELMGAVVTFVDITERKRLEEEHLRNQKLESLGVLAAGIAHDFNNMLTGIMGNLSLIPLQSDQGLREKLVKEAIKATDWAASLTGKLLAFAKGGTPQKTISPVANIVREATEFSLGKSSICRCNLDLADDLHMAEIDEGQIGQVIQNLVINARQAMPGGGVINVLAENVELSANNKYELEAGPFIHISVSDNGIGIPQKYLGRIFDPYFTTKDNGGGGSGLGLAVSHTIIKNHGGSITVESEQGKGATFHVFFPAIKERFGHKKIVEEDSGVYRKLKVLVMDDETMIRDVLHNMLSINHQVETTKNGQEALEVYGKALSSEEPFDVVILDLTIPGGMGGVETLRNLQAMDPKIVAIVSSGYSDTMPKGFAGILSKPYDFHKLESLLQTVTRNK